MVFLDEPGIKKDAAGMIQRQIYFMINGPGNNLIFYHLTFGGSCFATFFMFLFDSFQFFLLFRRKCFLIFCFLLFFQGIFLFLFFCISHFSVLINGGSLGFVFIFVCF